MRRAGSGTGYVIVFLVLTSLGFTLRDPSPAPATGTPPPSDVGQEAESQAHPSVIKTDAEVSQASFDPHQGQNTIPPVQRIQIPISDDAEASSVERVLGAWQSDQASLTPQPAQGETEDAGDTPAGATEELVRVTQVIDGDTIGIQGGQRVRYIGIDTPESTTQQECYGEKAKQRNRELVEGQLVRLEGDVEDRDKYGRLLRYVYLENKFINLALVATGYANTLTIPPNVAHVDEFRSAEQAARLQNLGLWGDCPADATTSFPTQDRTNYDETIPQAPGYDCPAHQPIKGNAQSKIYHVPGGAFYAKTKPEDCFSTEDEAVVAGYRRSKR